MQESVLSILERSFRPYATATPDLFQTDRFWLGVFAGVATGLIAIAVIAPLADVLARRDVINAQTACRRAGGEVLLSDDGTWRCVPVEER